MGGGRRRNRRRRQQRHSTGAGTANAQQRHSKGTGSHAQAQAGSGAHRGAAARGADWVRPGRRTLASAHHAPAWKTWCLGYPIAHLPNHNTHPPCPHNRPLTLCRQRRQVCMKLRLGAGAKVAATPRLPLLLLLLLRRRRRRRRSGLVLDCGLVVRACMMAGRHQPRAGAGEWALREGEVTASVARRVRCAAARHTTSAAHTTRPSAGRLAGQGSTQSRAGRAEKRKPGKESREGGSPASPKMSSSSSPAAAAAAGGRCGPSSGPSPASAPASAAAPAPAPGWAAAPPGGAGGCLTAPCRAMPCRWNKASRSRRLSFFLPPPARGGGRGGGGEGWGPGTLVGCARGAAAPAAAEADGCLTLLPPRLPQPGQQGSTKHRQRGKGRKEGPGNPPTPTPRPHPARSCSS